MKNTNKYALITGATSGIGLELAKLFAADGFSLVLVAREQTNLDQAATELKQLGSPEVTLLSYDLFDPQAGQQVYEQVTAQGIKINVLVNNAGQGVYGKFIDNSLEDELKIVQLNIASLLCLTKQFLPDITASGDGKILNVASIASKAPGPWQAVYHGTKAFVHSFSEALNYELKETGVTVTSLLPGATDTDFFNKAGMESAKIVVEGDLAEAAVVAKDGYEALMAGKDMVVSGLKNKVNVAMGNFLPDSMQTAQTAKQQEPADEKS